MRRWHLEVRLMLRRWREEQRRHADINRILYGSAAIESTCHCLKGPGTFRKRRLQDCGRARCGVCHWGKLMGYRPPREVGRRGRLNARLEALIWEQRASGSVW